MSELHRQALARKGPSVSLCPPRVSKRSERNYSPVGWEQYFDEKKIVTIGDGSRFSVYCSSGEGPVLLLLHGGGFCGLTWALLTREMKTRVECSIIAPDLRGHGDTDTLDDQDLSIERQAEDVRAIVETLLGDIHPPIVLVGHSMGGAVAVHVASEGLIPNLRALVVIDVVEGSAMDALQSMQNFLRGRPQRFASVEEAIRYCVTSGQIRNMESARVSMVGQLRRVEGTMFATPSSVILEEGSSEPPPRGEETDHYYAWRINLSATERFWRGWFAGLSQRFLDVNAAKLLLLAGVDRLDRVLTIGQMQGKFQMQVLSQCGHAVHEDTPDRVSDVIASFLVRYQLATPLQEFQRIPPGC